MRRSDDRSTSSTTAAPASRGDARQRAISLNGTWLIRRDGGNVGLVERWFALPEHPVAADAWREIKVPSAWQHVLGETHHYLAWYQRRVALPEGWDWPRLRVRFESVATALDVWVDEAHIGSHCGDYVPFEFDITDSVLGRRAFTLTVRVDEQLGHITKGFHDMLSIHHGGIWGDVTLIGSGETYVVPDGVAVRADLRSGEVRIEAELARSAPNSRIEAAIRDADGTVVSAGSVQVESSDRAGVALKVDRPRRWSPHDPNLYTADMSLVDAEGFADTHTIHFGFRTLEARGTTILLNDAPLFVRGVLHWGHEPGHLSPAPTKEQARAEMEQLRAMGFNLVCLCMWYPPRHYYEIADELGMLIWQEHPVWHSPMDEALHAEYRRLFCAFMRRDRNHPSVVIVSSTCEHPDYHPALAAWWWETARRELPEHLLQVQTASFAWSDPAQTDLYDEHTYDNHDRWLAYLRDVQDALDALPPKPFVMGETVLGTSWVDVDDLRERAEMQGASVRWTLPRCHESMREVSRGIIETCGEDVYERFRRDADRHHLLWRKRQVEAFRRYPRHGGLVMNHLRDVPGCACGFMDGAGRWRFGPGELRDWLADATLLLETPGERRSFDAGEVVRCQVHIANFTGETVEDAIELDGEGVEVTEGPSSVRVEAGEVIAARCALQMIESDSPLRVSIRAAMPPADPRNAWDDCWVFPRADPSLWEGCARLADLPITEMEREPDRFERGYSCGFGLPCVSWRSRMPDPNEAAGGARAWEHDEPIPDRARVLITHRLTRRIIDFADAGGGVVLLASKAAGGIGTSYEWLFGQCPLVLEHGPLRAGDSAWIVDLLGADLTASYCRVMPVEELGIADDVMPIVRLMYTHDQPRVRRLDMMFAARVGSGVMVASAFDYRTPAGRFLLERAVRWVGSQESRGIESWVDLEPFCLR